MRTVAPVAARRASAPAPRVAAPSRPAARAAVRPLASVGPRVTLPANTLRKAGGQPLEPAVRRRLEMSFGADLSAVRVHTDAAAQAIAHRWNARALTQGTDILLGAGQRPTDLELLAHETAHVLQQRGVPVPRPYRPQGGDHFESEARQASHRVLLGQPVTIAAAASAPAVQRWALSDLGNMVGNLANTIPGFRLLTVVLGFNPISQERVERSAANLLRGLIELMVPVGTVISAALNQYGIFERAGRWVEQQFQSLDFRVDRIRGVLQRLLNPLETGAQQLLEAEIAPLKRFAMEMAVGLLRFVREAVLLPVADLASKTRGWELLTAVLGRNPITDETVPRKPETLIGGFLKLIGEDEVWQNIQQARALPRIATWFDGVSETVVGYVRELPLLFHKAWETLQIADLTAPITAFHKITQVFGRFVLSFVDWAGQALWTMLEILLDAIKPGVVGYLKKTGSALKSILKNPLPFMGYLIDAAKRGFEGFADRFGTHLKHGLLEWLTGSLPGIYIPKSFAFAEIVKFVFSVLGLSWQNLRAKLVKVVGEGPVTAIENGVTLVTKLITEGPAAAWQELQETLAGLKDQAISGITQMVTELIVLKAIPKLVAMFIPGAGFIPAALAIYDTIMVFVDKLKQILEVVKSFVDSIVAIAGGAIDAAAKQVERILGRLLSLAISFLMGFAGLGKVADKVLGVIKKLQAAVDKALDKLVDKVVKLAKKRPAAWSEANNKAMGGKEKDVDCPVKLSEEQHTVRVHLDGNKLRILMASAQFNRINLQLQKIKTTYGAPLRRDGYTDLAAEVEKRIDKAVMRIERAEFESNRRFQKIADPSQQLKESEHLGRQATEMLTKELLDKLGTALMSGQLGKQLLGPSKTLKPGDTIVDLRHGRAMIVREVRQFKEYHPTDSYELMFKAEATSGVYRSLYLYRELASTWQSAKRPAFVSWRSERFGGRVVIDKQHLGTGTPPHSDKVPFINQTVGDKTYSDRGHLVAAVLGGPGTLKNLVALTHKCNQAMKNGIEVPLKNEISKDDSVYKYIAHPIFVGAFGSQPVLAIEIKAERIFPDKPKRSFSMSWPNR
ncbi:MAG: DUF4157 domain-containing protein [Planctomycetaceae bacterium]